MQNYRRMQKTDGKGEGRMGRKCNVPSSSRSSGNLIFMEQHVLSSLCLLLGKIHLGTGPLEKEEKVKKQRRNMKYLSDDMKCFMLFSVMKEMRLNMRLRM